MTTITIDKELLEQVVNKLLTCWPKSDPLVNELRAALAAPATAPDAEVTVEHFRGLKSMENLDWTLYADLPPGTHKLYRTPPATAPAQPEIVDLLAEMYELILANKVVLAEKSGGVWTWPDRAIEAVRKHRSGPARAQADHKKSV
jgi:hypothetical protein